MSNPTSTVEDLKSDLLKMSEQFSHVRKQLAASRERAERYAACRRGSLESIAKLQNEIAELKSKLAHYEIEAPVLREGLERTTKINQSLEAKLAPLRKSAENILEWHKYADGPIPRAMIYALQHATEASK